MLSELLKETLNNLDMKVDNKTSLHDSGNVRVIHPREIIICFQYLFLYGTTAL